MRTRTCRAAGMGRVLCFVASVALFKSISVWAQQVNSWISPSSGNWDAASSWSLGALPASSQAVSITNAGFKAVDIDSGILTNFPASLTVSNLLVAGPTNGLNTLLLNSIGTGTSLKVLNNCTIGTNGVIVSSDSGFEVDGAAGGGLVVDGGTFTQLGGSSSVNVPVTVRNGNFNATNAYMTLGNVTLGATNTAGNFNQDGGSPLLQKLSIINGQYTLNSGILYAIGGTELDSFGQFLQWSGTNYGDIIVNANNPGSYTIDGGLAQGNVLTVHGSFYQGGGTVNMQTVDWTGNNGNVLALGTLNSKVFNVHGSALLSMGQGNFQLGSVQTGSLSVSNTATIALEGYNLIVTNILDISGDSSNTPARLEVQGSTATTSTINIGTVNLWPNSLMQQEFHTTTEIADGLNLAGGQFVLGNGTLNSAYISVGQNSTFTQNGGQNYINNGLSITGTYEETAGYAVMDGLYLHGALLLETNTFPIAFSFTNLGTLDFGGYLGIGMTNNSLGQVQLSSNAIIAFMGSSAAAHFAASSGESWLPGVLMVVSNWNNSGNTRLFFGSDASGLSTSQLSQIQFSNPGGLAPGVYTAKILSTGEVVPDQVVSSTSGTLNSWINSSSGNWDDASSWSLGIAPAASQSIYIANPSYKAVIIDSSTVSAAPQSLAVNSVAITSEPSGIINTLNTLLLNYAGAGNPLVIGVDSNSPGSLFVGTNSQMTMFSSGLIVNDSLSETNSRLGEFEVDGSFNQSANSEVVAGFLDLNGSYNVSNGMVFIGTQFINGRFNQLGGTNTGSVVESTNGDYVLSDGAFQGAITLSPGVFEQRGGTVSAQLAFAEPSSAGLYKLTGGTLLPGDLGVGTAPVTNFSVFPGGVIEQSGGTNSASSIAMGFGTYYLSNGVVTAPTMTLRTNLWDGVFYAADFEQYGGYNTNGGLTMFGGTNNFPKQVLRVPAKYNLFGGILETPSITMNASDLQMTGGTNLVGTLSMTEGSIYTIFDGGTLAVDQILANDSAFWHRGGTVGGMPDITLANGSWFESGTGVQLGHLQLSNGTNSLLYLPGGSCVLEFADSSGVSWAGDGRLIIQNWSGSPNGGGSQQVFFGTSGSGLTAQQLSQVQFSDPGGLPNGTYSAQILSDGEVVPNPPALISGTLNSWTNPASGNWDDATSWSLGILPNDSQSVLIANAGSKTVSINSATPVNFPASMTVSNFFIEGATNTENTLLLNNLGTSVPFTVLNGVTLKDSGQLVDLNSGLELQSGSINVTNSQMIQDGGFVRLGTNSMSLNDAIYNLTNGDFEAASVSIGLPRPAHFNQYGGHVTVSNVDFYSIGGGTNVNGYSLFGGTLNLPGGMELFGGSGGLSYFQSGGTNWTGRITIEPDYGGFSPNFTLNGGLLADSDMFVDGGPTIVQNGGTQVVTNALTLLGERTTELYPVAYFMNGGTLSAGTIDLGADNGDSSFTQTNGMTFAGTFDAHSQGYYSENNTTVTLSGGTLSCSNYTTLDGNGTLNQSAGALVVSNLLDFGGSRDVGGPGYPLLYGHYNFNGGTLTASNINISADLIIGDGTSNRISNPGTFTLSHLLQIGNAVEQLGHFVLAGTNAMIDLAGSASKLSFANSSGETWAGGATLTISDWNGNASGGGAEQLKFGSDPSGLTSAQLSQIQFAIGTNVYSAKILSTGEVVPNSAVGPAVTFSTQGHNFVMSWPAGWMLQEATNATGPYIDVPSATSPYTNDMTQQPRMFFRLRQ